MNGLGMRRRGLIEPALVLTPPEKGNQIVDGLLTAGEGLEIGLDALDNLHDAAIRVVAARIADEEIVWPGGVQFP